MSEVRRVKIKTAIPLPLDGVIEIDYEDWVLESLEPDPDAEWKVEDLNGVNEDEPYYVASPTTGIAVLRRKEQS